MSIDLWKCAWLWRREECNQPLATPVPFPIGKVGPEERMFFLKFNCQRGHFFLISAKAPHVVEVALAVLLFCWLFIALFGR